MTTVRTIVSAMQPRRNADSMTEVWLKVWFEELLEPVMFLATPYDVERHGRRLWRNAIKGEYGPIEVIDGDPQ